MKSLLVAIATSSAFSAPTFSEWAAKQHKGACVLPYQYILRGPSFTGTGTTLLLIINEHAMQSNIHVAV